MWPFKKKQSTPHNDFGTIGFTAGNLEDYKKIIMLAAEKGQWLETEKGFYIRLTSTSGAEFWGQTEKNRDLVGGHPFFDGKSKIEVKFKPYFSPRYSILDASVYTMLGSEDLDFPFFFDVVNYFTKPHLKENDTISVKIAAFAKEDFEIYNSYEEFSSVKKSLNLAEEAFIPAGTFNLEGQQAEPKAKAVFTGKVLECKELKNEFTGQKFYWLFVKTLNANFDVVVAPSIIKRSPKVGNFVFGTFWLAGKIL